MKNILLGNTKIKNIYSSKYTIKGMKRQLKGWKNIFNIYIQQWTCIQNIDIFKDLQFDKENEYSPITKWGRRHH